MSGRYDLPSRDVVYGPGAFERAISSVKGHRVFVVASPFVHDAVDRLSSELGSRFAGVFDGITMHVGMPSVLESAEIAREAGADTIVSIGGGSAIDGAKALTLCLAADIRSAAALAAYRRRRDGAIQMPDVELPAHVAVPTTLAGAESTAMFGVTDAVTREKLVFADRRFAVDTTVFDPWVAGGTPDWLWASSGMRAVDHAVEGILSAKHSPLHDATASEGLRILREVLVRSSRDPADVEARALCQVGAWLATCFIETVGVGLSHAIGHQLAPQFDMAHGVTSAVMLPHVMAFNATSTGSRLVRIAEALGVTDADPDAAVEGMHDFVAQLQPLGVPTTLAAAGATWPGLEKVASHVMDDPAVATNPRPVTRGAVMELFSAAWD